MAQPVEQIKVDFGKHLRKLRTQQGLSQNMAAKHAGLAHNTWQRYENAICRPGIDKAPRLAKALGLPVADLFPSDDGSKCVAEVRVSQATIEQIRHHGQYAAEEVAQRIATQLTPKLLALATTQAHNPQATVPTPGKRAPRPRISILRERAKAGR